MMNHKLLPVIISAVCLCGCSHIEKSEQAAISVETSIIDGRTAGRLYVVSGEEPDTAELKAEVKKLREKYDTLADRSLVNRFDSAMMQTIRIFRKEKPADKKTAPDVTAHE